MTELSPLEEPNRRPPRPLKPWHGFLFFLFVMAVFFLICTPMQYYWGMYGLAATELLILGLAILFAKAFRYPLKVLFPIKKPKFLHIVGVFVLWGSSYLVTMVASLIQFRMFPEQMTQVGNHMNELIWSVPFLLMVLITAVLPAICEEAVHRGILLHSMYSIKQEWVIVLLMGIYFGIFHTHPLRFLPTALLGAMLSFIMLETENMVYPAIFHFVNNFLPLLLQIVLANILPSDQTVADMAGTASNIPLATLGMYIIFASCVPFAFYFGTHLLHWKADVIRPLFPREHRLNRILWIVIPTVIIAGIGFLIFVYGLFFDPVLHEIIRESIQHVGIFH